MLKPAVDCPNNDYKSLADSDLVDLLKSEDQIAFTEIYNRYWKKLLAITYNYTRDKSAAKEIVQEIFISIWKRRDNIEIQSLNAYLATAVKFSVFKQICRQKRHDEIAALDYKKQTVALDEEKIDARFLQEYINGVVEQLPEKCRLVFTYSRKEGLTIPEISDKMGIASKTVEAHLTKGLRTLRLSLKDAGILILFLSLFIDYHI